MAPPSPLIYLTVATTYQRRTEKLIEQTFRFRLRTISCLLCNFVPNASILTLSAATCLLSSNICASASSNFWISAFTRSFLSCCYFPIENLGFLLLAANGGLKTPWFIFAKRRQKRRINTYLMNTEIELTSYHFRFFIKVLYTPKKASRKWSPWNPRQSLGSAFSPPIVSLFPNSSS